MERRATPASTTPALTRRTALLGGAAAVAGCARRRDPDALTFWAMSYEGDYSPHLMPAFTRATGIAVEVQSLPWTAAHEKLLTAHAGGSMPDVVMLPSGWVGEFAMIGALAPVADPALLADLFPGTLDILRYDGRTWAVPWAVAPQGQFYRRDLVAAAGYEAPPPDWKSWRVMARAMKRRRSDDFVVLSYLNWFDTLFTFAGQIGAPMLRDRDTRGAFREDRFRQALLFYKSLFDERLAPRALSTELQDPVAAFAQGFFALYPSGPALLLDFRRRAAELPRRLWSTARMPGPGGPGPVTSLSGTVAVTASAKRPDAAWALVRHLTSPASELRFQDMIGSLPARLAAWTSPQLATPVLAPFRTQLAQPGQPIGIVEWERIRLDVQTIAERVVRGDIGVDDGLRRMDARVDAILGKRRALVEAGMLA